MNVSSAADCLWPGANSLRALLHFFFLFSSSLALGDSALFFKIHFLECIPDEIRQPEWRGYKYRISPSSAKWRGRHVCETRGRLRPRLCPFSFFSLSNFYYTFLSLSHTVQQTLRHCASRWPQFARQVVLSKQISTGQYGPCSRLAQNANAKATKSIRKRLGRLCLCVVQYFLLICVDKSLAGVDDTRILERKPSPSQRRRWFSTESKKSKRQIKIRAYR